MGQSFLGNGQRLLRVGWYLRKVGSPTGNATVSLYAHTGTFGTSSKANGAALATSTTVLDVSSLTTSSAWVDFEFDATATLTNATPYVIAVSFAPGATTSDYIQVRRDQSSPTAPGNYTT